MIQHVRRKNGRPFYKELLEKVSVIQRGLSFPEALYKEVREPRYLEIFVDGPDMLVYPRWVKTEDTYTLWQHRSSRVLFIVPDVLDLCPKGAYNYLVETVDGKAKIRILGCIKDNAALAIWKRNV